MSETTPPPEDDSFPQVYSMTSNSYTSAPAPAPTPVTNPAKLVPNYFASDKQPTSGPAAEKLSKSSEELSSRVVLGRPLSIVISTNENDRSQKKKRILKTRKETALALIDEIIPEVDRRYLF